MFVFTEKILSYLNGTNSTNSRSRIYLFVHLLLETLLRVAAVQLTQAREGNHGRGQGVVVQHALDPWQWRHLCGRRPLLTTDHSPTKSEDAGYISLLSRVFTFTSILLMSSALTSFRNSYLSCSCNIVHFSLRIFSSNINTILLKDQRLYINESIKNIHVTNGVWMRSQRIKSLC